VFSVTPVEGLMFPGKAQDFTVTFSPDHESLYFSDQLQVVLFEKVQLETWPGPMDPIPPRKAPVVYPLPATSEALITWWLCGYHVRDVKQRPASVILWCPTLR
jgi:hypothetical protein